jgi:CBS domain containing-hemolysin-like protein
VIEILIVILLFLLVLNLLTVAVQAALLQVSLPRLLLLHEQEGWKVDRAIALLQASLEVQASINLARLLSRFAMAALIVYSIFLFQPAYTLLIAAAVLFFSALALNYLELFIQVFVLRNPGKWLIRLTWIIRTLMILLAPFVKLGQLLSGNQQSVPEVPATIAVSEDDLRTLVEATNQPDDVLEPGERRMIHSIFELGTTLAREIMVPRIDMLALDVMTPLPGAVDAFMKSGHSRVPVYEDTVDNILGLLYAKDLLSVWQEGGELESLRPLLRRAYFVPEAKKVDELLAELQRQRVHMAVVVDEYGGIAGLVTLEDIVEEIVGEIQDEYDQAEELPYEELANGEYIFLGRIDLDDFNEITTSNLPKDEADTLAGFIYSRLGRVPSTGENLQADNLLLTVEQVSGRRIRKVRVQATYPEQPDEERVTDVSD